MTKHLVQFCNFTFKIQADIYIDAPLYKSDFPTFGTLIAILRMLVEMNNGEEMSLIITLTITACRIKAYSTTSK